MKPDLSLALYALLSIFFSISNIGKAWVYQDPEFRGCGFVYDDEPTTTSTKSTSTSSLDVNAREFVPKRIVEDEAAASGDDVASTHSGSSLSASAKEFVPGNTKTQ